MKQQQQLQIYPTPVPAIYDAQQMTMMINMMKQQLTQLQLQMPVPMQRHRQLEYFASPGEDAASDRKAFQYMIGLLMFEAAELRAEVGSLKSKLTKRSS